MNPSFVQKFIDVGKIGETVSKYCIRSISWNFFEDKCCWLAKNTLRSVVATMDVKLLAI